MNYPAERGLYHGVISTPRGPKETDFDCVILTDDNGTQHPAYFADGHRYKPEDIIEWRKIDG
jgi:hypothetical protein